MNPRRILNLLAALAALLNFAPAVQAAPGDLDSTFGTAGKVIASIATNDVGRSVAVQGDGKILLAGSSTDGSPDNFAVVRYTANGVLDTSFGPGGTGIATTDVSGSVDYGQKITLQSDGKILVVGQVFNGSDYDFGLVRYETDGSLDGTFGTAGKVITPIGSGDNAALAVAVQPDGAIVAAGACAVPGGNDIAVVRYTASGALDTTFGGGTGIVTTSVGSDDAALGVVVQGDGKIIVACYSNTGTDYDMVLVRYTDSGGLDAGFGTGGIVTTPISSGNDFGTGLALQGDGKIIVSGAADGDFAVVRYTSSGALDTSFNSTGKVTTAIGGGNDNAQGVVVQGDGKIVLAGFSDNGSGNDFALVRYNADGSLDTDFHGTGKVVTDFGGGDVGASVALQGDGKILVGGYSNAVGGGDNDFVVARYVGAPSPGEVDSLVADVTGAHVLGSAQQPDGKTIIYGTFTAVNGVARNNIARLNADGSLDLGFDPNTSSANGTNGRVNAVAVLPDGKIVIAGFFTELNGLAVSRTFIARLNADGSVDQSFDLQVDHFVYGLAAQPDGKLLLWGIFDSVLGVTRHKVARLNANGTLDLGFDPNPNDFVFGAAVQADGKVLLGGGFTSLDPNGAGSPVARRYFARVNDDGTVDPGFDPNPDVRVFSTRVQADGKVLLSGDFSALQPNGAPAPTTRNHIARVNADGSLDTGFNPDAPDFEVNSVALQVNGQVLFTGGFGTVQGTTRNRVARVAADGTLDANFDPNLNDGALSVTLQADGKVLLGGVFTTVQPNGAASPTPRSLFARLFNEPATGTVSALDATQVLWQRGGTAPEVTGVLFERSVDGGATWASLGIGARVGTTANWQLTGVNLLHLRGQVRALGFVAGGYFNGSSGLIQQTGNFDFDTVGGITLTPMLTKPEANSLTHLAVGVDFTLPEAAKPGSVTLTFDDEVNDPIVLTLASSQETAGRHQFDINPAQVTDSTSGGAIASATSGTIPDGTYIVTLSYQDTSNHPAATTMNTNVELDNIQPMLDLAPRFVQVDAQGMATMPDLSSIASDANGISDFTQNPAAGDPLYFGEIYADVSATDGAGNTATGIVVITVGYNRPTNPSVASIAAAEENAPAGARFGVEPPAGAKLATFGAPAISDNRLLVAKGTLALGTKKIACLYEEDATGAAGLVAYQGSDAPGIAGAKFKSFLDPLISPEGGFVVFAGKVSGGGTKTTNDDGVWRVPYTPPVSSAALLLREGDDMPGFVPGVKLKSVVGLSLRGDGLLALVKLARKPGSITAANDTALVQVLSATSGDILLQTNDPITIGTLPETKIKTITALAPALGSPGHGRWHANGLILAKITLVDKRSAIVQFVNGADPNVLVTSGDDAGAGAKWASFGIPAQCGVPDDIISLGTLAPLANVVNKTNDSAIGVSMGLGMFTAVQRESLDTPILGTKWASFFDPVMNDYGQSAFLSTIKGTGVTKANRTVLWYGDAANPDPIARLSDPNSPVPDTAGDPVAGRTWAAITSYAIPYGPQSGLVFVAKVKGTGVTPASSVGLYAMDTQNTLRELLRTNDPIGAKFVKSFTVLNAVPGAYSVARSTNLSGSIAVVVTFTDKKQALVRIDVP